MSLANESSLWSSLQEKLILWQLKGESELFSYLNLLRMSQPNKNLRLIGKDEAMYFDYYKSCFLLEIICLLCSPIVGYCGFKFYKEFKKPINNPKTFHQAFVRLIITSLPTFNLFLFNTYRRYMHTVPYENTLKIKYQQEIREIKKRKFESK